MSDLKFSEIHGVASQTVFSSTVWLFVLKEFHWSDHLFIFGLVFILFSEKKNYF